MIEKLTTYPRPLPNNPMVVENIGMDNKSLFDKINELVDAVNELKLSIKPILEERESGIKVYEEAQDMYDKAPADPYAEQRKWIGKLCEFWDNDDTQQLSYGVLTKIDTESGFGVQYCCNDEYDYDDCQPVKPDDDIIYKGGDNE